MLVKSMRRGFDFTMSKEMNNEMQEMIKTKGTSERKGREHQAQENKSELIHARKVLELRIEVLVDAISKCHMAVATRKSWKEIEASMDTVEIAWDKIRRTRSEFGSDAGLNFDHLPMMVDMVLTKA